MEVRETGYTWIYPDVPGKDFWSENSTDPKLEYGWELVNNHKEDTMGARVLFYLGLLAAGYVLGMQQPGVQAQAPMQGFNSDGSSYLYYPPSGQGGVGQYFGSNGQSGQIYSPPASFGQRSPC